MCDAGWDGEDGCHDARLQPPTQRLWSLSATGEVWAQNVCNPRSMQLWTKREDGQHSSGRPGPAIGQRCMPAASGGLARQCHCNHCTRCNHNALSRPIRPRAAGQGCVSLRLSALSLRAAASATLLSRSCCCFAEPIHSTLLRNEGQNPDGLNTLPEAKLCQCRRAGRSKVIEFKWAGLCANPTQHKHCARRTKRRQTLANKNNANVGGSAATPPFSGWAARWSGVPAQIQRSQVRHQPSHPSG